MSESSEPAKFFRIGYDMCFGDKKCISIVYDKEQNEMFQRISDKLKDDGSKLGNKGKFLCKLYQAGFLVPDGVILDSDVYFEFLRENKLTDKVTALINALNKENISHISAEIKDLFESAQLPSDIKQHLSKELDLTKAYAVRSSGTKEDLDDYSFAGQYDTFLNVKGIDEICSFVRHIFLFCLS